MIDGMITATAVVATMPLIHNNAADFEPFSSAIGRASERFPNVRVHWSRAGVQLWHEAGRPGAGFSLATDAETCKTKASRSLP
jgi:hypothetical protein